MANITESIYKIRFLDDEARKTTWVHSIHPLAKVIVTIVYLIIVVSFGKYDIVKMLPLVFYPVVIIGIAEIPVKALLKRVLLASVFVAGIGIFNPIFDREIRLIVLNIGISGGWISFLSVVLKCCFTVIGSLLMVATTGMDNIALAFRMLKIPKLFVLQLLQTYRYIIVLMEEVGTIINAYKLRAPGQKGIRFNSWGSLVGQILIRSFARAERVHAAMILRGFNGEYKTGFTKKLLRKDWIYIACWITFFIICRYYNLPELLGTIAIGVKK
jgi:cobalt/nickel transport system permease protein